MPEILTLPQVAELLQVEITTVRRMISRGELKAYRYGPKLIRVDRRDIDKMRRPVTTVGGAA